MKWFKIMLICTYMMKENIVIYHQPPCGSISSFFLTEKVRGKHGSMEQAVVWLTQNLNHALHLQTESTRSHQLTV